MNVLEEKLKIEELEVEGGSVQFVAAVRLKLGFDISSRAWLIEAERVRQEIDQLEKDLVNAHLRVSYAEDQVEDFRGKRVRQAEHVVNLSPSLTEPSLMETNDPLGRVLIVSPEIRLVELVLPLSDSKEVQK